MEVDLDLVRAQGLDRLIELDLAALDLDACGGSAIGDVARGHRTVELQGLGRLADEDDLEVAHLGADALGFLATLEVLSLQRLTLRFEVGDVVLGGAQRLLLRQQEVAGVTGLHLHHVAQLTELGHALQQDDVHRHDCVLRLGDEVGQERQETRALDRLGEFALLLGRHRRDAARHDLAALRDEALQKAHVLVVDLRRIGAGERAALAAAREGTALGAHSSSPTAATGAMASSPKRGRSRRGGRSPQRSPRSPPGRSDFSALRSMMAEGPSSSASTRTVRKRMMSSLIDIVRSISFTAADGASMLSRV